MSDIKWFINNGDYFYFKDAPAHLSGVSLDKSEISLTTVGQTEQLTATIIPANPVETVSLNWSSSDTSIATVDNTGLVTCVTPGECTITVTTTPGSYTASCGVKKARLPNEYQEVEYIQSSGTQYINTGVNGSGTGEWEMKYNNLGSQANNWEQYIGGSSTDTAARLYHQNSGDYVVFARGSDRHYAASGTYADADFVVTATQATGLSIGGSVLASYTPGAWNADYWIFANSNEPSSIATMKLFYLKMRTNGVLVRDFVPCYRKQDSVAGLYDMVNDQFYTNDGTGTFVVGPNVT